MGRLDDELRGDMLEVPLLKTERLILEPFSKKHSPGMFELWLNPEMSRYSGPVSDFWGNPIEMPAASPLESDKILDFFIRHQEQGTAFRWAIMLKDESEFTGAVGFNSLGQCSEIAFHLQPRFWGKGIMSEAYHAATSTFGSPSIDAYVDPENLASIRLIHRLRFTQTGESKEGADRYLLHLRNTGQSAPGKS